MIEAAKAIETIQACSSSTEKILRLKAYENVPGLKAILKFIYNPYHKTGISDAKLDRLLFGNEGQFKYLGEVAPDYMGIMAYLTTHNTGSHEAVWKALTFIKNVSDCYKDPFATRLARGIVTQNFQIGVTATTLNKVYGADFIPKTGCILGTPYKDVPANKLEWPYIVTEKLDGNRRVIIKENGVCRAFTRSGHEDNGLIEIMPEMKHMPSNFAYDGELLAIGTFKDCIALRQATASIANLKGDKRGLTMNMFDMVPVEEFFAGKSRDTALVRKIRLGATLMDQSISVLTEDWYNLIQAFGIHRELSFIKSVPILAHARCMADVEPIATAIWNKGFEGVMLNSTGGFYEFKRSRSLLKLKRVKEYVLQVVDVLEGDNKYEDNLGKLVVRYKDSYVKVGSGFTDYQRAAIWAEPSAVIGRYVEIDSFGESTNAQGGISLNCPIFKRFTDEVPE